MSELLFTTGALKKLTKKKKEDTNPIREPTKSLKDLCSITDLKQVSLTLPVQYELGLQKTWADYEVTDP